MKCICKLYLLVNNKNIRRTKVLQEMEVTKNYYFLNKITEEKHFLLLN